MADGHGAITLGSGCSGGIRNIFAEDCYLDSPALDTAVRVKNNAFRGGLLQNFNVRNIRVGRVSKQVSVRTTTELKRNLNCMCIRFRL